MASLAPSNIVSQNIQVRRKQDYPHDDLGFLQRIHPLRGAPFGRLIYMADSIMQPMREPGFGMHPHVNVEVISYVVDGALSHRDSAGNNGIVPAGAFQRITAGTGVEHDESNRTDAPLRMFQIWFAPRVQNVEPSYATIETAGKTQAGTFYPVIRGDGADHALSINADASISLGHFGDGDPIDIEVAPGRTALIYAVTGGASWNAGSIDAQDQIRVHGPANILLSSVGVSELLLIESAA